MPHVLCAATKAPRPCDRIPQGAKDLTPSIGFGIETQQVRFSLFPTGVGSALGRAGPLGDGAGRAFGA